MTPNAYAARPGLDHPLIVVRDLPAAVAAFSRLGFTLTPESQHPWGTRNSLAVLRRSLIELITIGDANLLDEMPAGAFRFGRYIEAALREGEGVSLVALHSRDIDADAARMRSHGAAGQGRIAFRRPARGPDGQVDEAVVALDIFVDDALPRASHFLCQQMRPDVLWRPQWMEHANGATHIAAVTYVTNNPSMLAARLEALFGPDAVEPGEPGLRVLTASGEFRVQTPLEATEVHAPLGLPPPLPGVSSVASISIGVPSLARVVRILESSQTPFVRLRRGIGVRPTVGEVNIVFEECAPPSADAADKEMPA